MVIRFQSPLVYVDISSFFFMGLLCLTHMGPIWAAHICDNPYGIHAEPDCTPHMGSIWVAHIGPIYIYIYICLATDLTTKVS